MTNATRFCLKLIVLGCVASAFAFQAASPPNGISIYKRRCMMCHGRDGKGFPAMKSPDFSDPKWQASAKDKEMIEVIKNGKKGTHMPAFADKLKDDEIQAVAAYLRSLNAKKKSPDAPAEPSLDVAAVDPLKERRKLWTRCEWG